MRPVVGGATGESVGLLSLLLPKLQEVLCQGVAVWAAEPFAVVVEAARAGV